MIGLTNQKERDWFEFPKFRHNLLTTYDDNSDLTYLTVSHSTYELSTTDASLFLRMRTYCTGNNNVDEIAVKSRLPISRVVSMLNSMAEANVVRPHSSTFETYSKNDLQQMLLTVTGMWGEQLEATYIASSIAAGKETYETVIGWLLETYHYLKGFPGIIHSAAEHAEGELKDVLAQYASQERGHEGYILNCLMKLDFKKEEIESSIPLVSTSLMNLLMKQVGAAFPCSVLLIARMIEADQNATKEQLGAFAKNIERNYNLPSGVLGGLTEHSLIDFEAGHSVLANKYQHLIQINSRQEMDFLINSLHDIKHAFDVQSLEIREYYNKIGNYIPRQCVDMYSI